MFTKLAKHDDDEGEGDEGEAVGCEFFIAGGNSAEWFELVEERFDWVALLVARLVINAASQAIGLGGKQRLAALDFELGPAGLAVLGLVHRGPLEPSPRVDGRAERFTARRISPRPRRNPASHPRRFRRAAGLDFRGQAAAGAAEGRLAFVLAAPAACWGARTPVASSHPLCRSTPFHRCSRCRISPPTPRWSLRCPRLEIVSQGPEAVGHSRQGVPVRSMGSMPSRASRCLTVGGRPRLP